MLKQFLLASFACALAVVSGFGVSTKAEAKPVYTVAMDAAYPPFGSQDLKSKEYVGYDVDKIRNLQFDGLIPALRTGNIDIAINDITITPDRAKNVDFSHRYYIAGLGVVVQKNNRTIRTAKDLEGKRLGVSIGSTGEEAARKIKNADVHVYNQLNEAYLELRNGGVDAVVNDIPTNDYYVATAGRGAVKALPVALTQEDLGIAVKKGNTKLLTQINDGLAKIKKDGEFAKIYHKWFGKQPPKALLHD